MKTDLQVSLIIADIMAEIRHSDPDMIKKIHEEEDDALKWNTAKSGEMMSYDIMSYSGKFDKAKNGSPEHQQLIRACSQYLQKTKPK